MIPRNIVIGTIFTSIAIRGHWMSIHFNNRSNLENALKNVICYMYAHIIHVFTLGYVLYTLKVIKGHWKSNK